MEDQVKYMVNIIIEHLEINEQEEDSYIINNTITNRYVKLGKRELHYLFEVKGMKNQNVCYAEELNEEQKQLLNKKFEEWGYLNSQVKKEKKKRDAANIILFEFDSNKRLSSVMDKLKILVSPFGLFLAIISVAMIVYAFMFEFDAILAIMNKPQFRIQDFVVLYILTFISAMLHELSHITACYKYSGRTGKVGMKLFYLFPAFFCDVSNIYMINSKKKSFIVSIAGLISNIVTSGIALMIYLVLYHYQIYSMVLLYFFVLNLVLILFNLMPFAKFDGYWILKSMVGIDNLYDKSIVLFLQSILNVRMYIKTKMSFRKKAMLTLYGASAFLFHWLFWLYSVIGLNIMLEQYAHYYLQIVLVTVLVGIALINCIKFTKQYYVVYKQSYK